MAEHAVDISVAGSYRHRGSTHKAPSVDMSMAPQKVTSSGMVTSAAEHVALVGCILFAAAHCSSYIAEQTAEFCSSSAIGIVVFDAQPFPQLK